MSQLKKILIAEDDFLLRETLVEMFTQAQFEVTAVEHGVEALNKLQAESFSLLITDLHMRPMNGLALLEALRSNPKWNSLPVIILTADPLHELRIKGLEGGVNDYLNKPFSFKELMLRAQNMLSLITSNQENEHRQRLSELPAEIQTKIDDTFLNRIDQYLRNHLNESINIDALAEYCRLSRSGLDKKMRQYLATSPSHYIRQFKLQKAKDMLLNSQLSVKEISQLTGFNSLSYFSTCYTKQYGHSPNKYRS